MAKVLTAVKLFDTRRPFALSNRSRRSCLCGLEALSKCASLTSKDPSLSPLSDQQCESINSSCKENVVKDNVDDDKNKLLETILDDIDECCFAERICGTPSILSSIDDTSNSRSCNSDENCGVSSAENTNNSSWNNISRESIVESCNECKILEHCEEKQCSKINTQTSSVPKFVRNKFPMVFNNFETSVDHMNLCNNRDDIVIPISSVRSYQTPKHQTISTSENSTEYDIDSDRLNTSLVEITRNTSDKISLRSLSQKYSLKCKNKKVEDNIREVTLNVYISDVLGVEESLILNKDRRFSRIMDRYKCTASIVQRNNMSRGFPHTLLKITATSKMHLQCMSRDADKIHPQWNLRSQLRSVHA